MKTVAAFTLGFGAGMVCLAIVLWNTGSLATHAEAGRALPETIQFKQLPLPPAPAPAATGRASLGMPISGVDPHNLKSNFSEARGGHTHEALDIMAPRGTPVLAVAEGNVVK